MTITNPEALRHFLAALAANVGRVLHLDMQLSANAARVRHLGSVREAIAEIANALAIRTERGVFVRCGPRSRARDHLTNRMTAMRTAMTRATMAIVRVFMVCLRAGRDQLATLLRFADRFDPPNGVQAESRLVARATKSKGAVAGTDEHDRQTERTLLVWRWRTCADPNKPPGHRIAHPLADRFGQRCGLLAQSPTNGNRLVEFEDGYRVVAPLYATRAAK